MPFGRSSPSDADLKFPLFGFPIRVQPLFWVGAIFIGFPMCRHPDLRISLLLLSAWVAAVFLGVLLHELGHAVIYRTYGTPSTITLWTMGGVTQPQFSYGSDARSPGPWGEMLISVAGPMTGFLVAGVTFLLLWAVGTPLETWTVFRFIPLLLPEGFLLVDLRTLTSTLTTWLVFFIASSIFVNVIWGVFNLLPIYPLDGGHIAREVLLLIDRNRGIERAWLLSIITAGLLAGLTLMEWVGQRGARGIPFMPIIFGLFAYQSYRGWQAYRGSRYY